MHAYGVIFSKCGHDFVTMTSSTQNQFFLKKISEQNQHAKFGVHAISGLEIR